MATFDDKSIFNKKENVKAKEKPKTEAEEELEIAEEVLEENLNVEETETLEEEVDAKVIGEELIESETVRKHREKREKKQKRIEEKNYNKMVKKHRKAMRKNPENIKRYDTDAEKGLPEEVVEKRILDNLVNTTKKGSTKSRKKIILSNIFTFFNILTLSIAIWLMTNQAWTDLEFL